MPGLHRRSRRLAAIVAVVPIVLAVGANPAAADHHDDGEGGFCVGINQPPVVYEPLVCIVGLP